MSGKDKRRVIPLGEQPSDPIHAAFERTSSRFAQATGVDIKSKEASMTEKTAQPEKLEGGSQVETAQDRGDYSTQQQAVADQARETAGKAPDGTPPHGSQNMTQRNDDKSYSHVAGSGGAAKLSAIATIAEVVKGHPMAAEVMGQAIKLAAEVPGVANANTENLDEVGGVPAAVEEGQAAAEEETATPATEEAAGVPEPSDQSTQVKLEDTIRDKKQELDIEKQVLDELKDVYQEVTGKKLSPKAAKVLYVLTQKTAAGEVIELPDQIGSGTYNRDLDVKPQPDKALYDQSKGATAEPRHNRNAAGQEFADFADKDYKLAGRRKTLPDKEYKAVLATVNRMVKDGHDFKKVAVAVSKTKVGRRVFASIKRLPVPKAKVVMAGMIQSLVKGGMDKTAAVKVMANTSLGYWLKTAAKGRRRKTAARPPTWRGFADKIEQEDPEAFGRFEVGDAEVKENIAAYIDDRRASAVSEEDLEAVSLLEEEFNALSGTRPAVEGRRRKTAADHVGPTGDSMDSGKDTTHYSGQDAGDKGDDEISDGTNTTLESSDTQSAAAAGRQEANRQFAGQTQGTTAFKKEERKKIIAELKSIDKAHDAMSSLIRNLNGKIASSKANNDVMAAIQQSTQELKDVGDAIEAALKSSNKNHKRTRSIVAQKIKVGRALVGAARRQVSTISGLMVEAKLQRKRFERVLPAFKLAAMMMQAGQLDVNRLPEKVAEFIKMSPGEFKVAAKTIGDLIKTTSGRAGRQRTASRIPHVSMGGSVGEFDELDGVFDDE